jgi:Zn-dependent protease with chaperone function
MIAQQKAGAGGLLQKFLSDHPADEQRIRDIEAFLPQVIPIYEQNRGRY